MPFFAGALALLVAGIAAAAVPPYLRGVRHELSRARWMEQVARSLGFAFSLTDPAYPGSSAVRFPFELFSRGIERTCENVMTGIVDGAAVTAFDFSYVINVDSDGDPDNDARSEPVFYSCALATVPGHRPHVVIEPASAPLSSRADGEPVRLEWGAFNARYRVVSPERSFATALCDLELMAWLVDRAPQLPLTWEVQRDRVLCRAPRLDPDHVAEQVRALAQFARRIGRGAAGSALARRTR